MYLLRCAWLAILIGSACVFILPETREAAGERARLVLGLAPPELSLPERSDERSSSDPLQKRLASQFAAAARANADDVEIQMGYASWLAGSPQDERQRGMAMVEALRRVLTGHRNLPAVYACLLLYDAKWVTAPGLPDFVLWAVKGEALEPDNAFLPAMRAVGLAHAGRTAEAMACVERASAKPRWNDHYTALLAGRMRLYRAVYGRLDWERALACDLLQPSRHTAMEDLARLVDGQAKKLERAGNRAAALRVRLTAIRLGNLERSQSPTLFGALAGSALMSMALRHTAEASGYHRDPGLAVDLNRARERAAFHAYARSAGHAEAIPQLDRAAGLVAATLSFFRAASSLAMDRRDPSMLPFWALYSAPLLSGVLWLALTGAAMAWIHRTSEPKARKQRAIAAWCAGLAFFAWQAHAMAGLGHWVKADGGEAEWLAGVGVAAMGIGILHVAHLPAYLTNLVLLVRWKRSHRDATKQERNAWWEEAHTSCLRANTLPAAALTMALFAWVMTNTARYESRLNADLNAQLTGEGRYYAHLLGKTWPR